MAAHGVISGWKETLLNGMSQTRPVMSPWDPARFVNSSEEIKLLHKAIFSSDIKTRGKAQEF